MIKKIISSILILSLILIVTTGNSDVNNIDDLGYVVAIGLDVGQSNIMKLSVQISIPSNAETKEDVNSVVNSVECATIDSGINMINSFTSKELELSHCKVIVISEDLAAKGISDYIFSLKNKIQVRPDTNIIISNCDAEYYLNNSKPILEELPARYYELTPSSSQYTGYTENIKLKDFFAGIIDSYSEAHAILGGINTSSTHKQADAEETNIERDSNYIASQMPSQAGNNIDNIGIAVFKDDKLVGELNAIETMMHLIVTNNFDTGIISIPSPIKQGGNIDLQIILRKSTKKKAHIVNGMPFIKTKIYLRANILSMTENSEYLSQDNIKKIEDYVNSYIESEVSEVLYKTAKEFKSDIFGFGRYAAMNFATWKEWNDYNWKNNYQNSFFDVEVDTIIKSEFLLIQT